MTRVGTVFLDLVIDAGKAGKDLEDFGKRASRNVSAPIAGAAALAVKQFAGYESSLARVTGLSGVAREQVQAWSGDVQRIGTDYAIGARQAADALYFVTSSGIATGDALGVVEQSAKASAAGLGEAETIADLTTSALNAYRGTGLDAAKATDVLTAAVAAGKGEPAEFAESLGRVLPIASALGVSYEQVAGAEAAMTLRGLDASEATTALRGIFTALLKPTVQAEEALAGVGLSSEGLRRQLKEQGLLATLETLSSSLGDDASATAAVFENVRALNGVMNILGVNTEETRRVMDQVANSTGATDRAFESMADTTEFKLKQGLERVNVALIGVGEHLAPIATTIADFVADASERFGRLPQPIRATALTIGSLAAAVGPTAFVVGKLTTTASAAARSMRDFFTTLALGNAANAATGLGRIGGFLGSISRYSAAAGISVAALGAGLAIVIAKMKDAESFGNPLKALADPRLKGAKSMEDLQSLIGDVNGEIDGLNQRMEEASSRSNFTDPVEMEQLKSMGVALQEIGTQAAKFAGQGISISDAMGIPRDAAAQWVVEQARLGTTFANGEAALTAYRASLNSTTGATSEVTTATGKLAAAAGPLSGSFFNLQAAQRGYDTSLRAVVTAQRQVEDAQRGVSDAERNHETSLRRVTDAEQRRQQTLRGVEEAQWGVLEAQRALDEALQGPSTDDTLNKESAELAVERARQRLDEIGKTKPGEKSEPVDPLDRREAQLALRRAENDLLRVNEEASGRVVTAHDNLRDAQDRLSDSQRQADEAGRAVADAQRGVGDALRGIGDARQGAEDAVIAVRDAEWQAWDAARNLGTAQDAFNSALSRGPNLAGPFIGYLEQMRDRFPEVAGGIQGTIDKFRELEAMQPKKGWDTQPPRPADGSPWSPNSLDGRAFGGPVAAKRPYEVTELGAPELFTNGSQQWMIPPVAGQVIPLQAMSVGAGGSGGGPAIVIEHLDVHGPDPVETARRTVIDMSKKAALAVAR